MFWSKKERGLSGGWRSWVWLKGRGWVGKDGDEVAQVGRDEVMQGLWGDLRVPATKSSLDAVIASLPVLHPRVRCKWKYHEESGKHCFLNRHEQRFLSWDYIKLCLVALSFSLAKTTGCQSRYKEEGEPYEWWSQNKTGLSTMLLNVALFLLRELGKQTSHLLQR